MYTVFVDRNFYDVTHPSSRSSSSSKGQGQVKVKFKDQVHVKFMTSLCQVHIKIKESSVYVHILVILRSLFTFNHIVPSGCIKNRYEKGK